MRQRNIDLHTGAPSLEDLTDGAWLTDYYRVVQLLLSHLDKDLLELFDEKEKKAALEMIAAADDKLKKGTLDKISEMKKKFEALKPEEQTDRRNRAAKDTPAMRVRAAMLGSRRYFKDGVCPACGAACLMSGESISVSNPKLEEGDIVLSVTVMPTKLECRSCGLTLESHSQLHAAGLGGTFTTREVQDPVEFHKIDVAEYLADYYEPEYDNE